MTQDNTIYPTPTLKELHPSPKVHKPKNWARNSNAPYYKVANAEWIKRDIDEMILNRKNLIYRYDKYCREGDISQNSFYQKINQAIRFLIDFLDKEGNYANWYRAIRIHKEVGIGIAFSWRPGADGIIASPDFVENDPGKESTYVPVWKQKMNTWLETENTEPLVIERIILTAEDVVSVNNELAQLSGLEYSVTQTSIKIVKT